MKKSKRPAKLANLLDHVREAIISGNYVDLHHATVQKQKRNITRPEYEYVLKNGFHEKKKDKYEDLYQEWSYAIRGKTIDDRDLRIAISFDCNDMLIITVIDLNLE